MVENGIFFWVKLKRVGTVEDAINEEDKGKRKKIAFKFVSSTGADDFSSSSPLSYYQLLKLHGWYTRGTLKLEIHHDISTLIFDTNAFTFIQDVTPSSYITK